MSGRLNVNDTVIHRIYGHAKVEHLFLELPDGPQARIRVTGERASRRVWLRDIEKEPPPFRPILRLVESTN